MLNGSDPDQRARVMRERLVLEVQRKATDRQYSHIPISKVAGACAYPAVDSLMSELVESIYARRCARWTSLP